MSRHIALVEDEQIILDNYADFLADLGYKVDRYSSKAEALLGLADKPPELVLLDISMNGEREAGFDICGEIRRRAPLLPVIFLSSYSADTDRISGLRLGADDYVTKDVSLEYLVARIEALFRRRDAYAFLPPTSSKLEHTKKDETQNIQFDQQRSTVTWRAQPVGVTLTQFWILHELCRVPGQTRTTGDLMRAAKLTVEPNTIAAHIKTIRKVFLGLDASFDLIRTERGRGYRWISC